MHDAIGDDFSTVVIPADLPPTYVGWWRGDVAWSRHDLWQFDNLVHALDAVIDCDLNDRMLFFPQLHRSHTRLSFADPPASGIGRRPGDLPRSLVIVLHAGAHEDAPASRSGDRRADGQPPQVIGLVRDYGTSRKRPPAPERRSPLETSLGTPARPAPRTRLGLLAALRVGDAVQACHFGRRDRTASRFEDFHRVRSPRAGVYGSCADAGRRWQWCNARPTDQDGGSKRRDRAYQESRGADERKPAQLIVPWRP